MSSQLGLTDVFTPLSKVLRDSKSLELHAFFERILGSTDTKATLLALNQLALLRVFSNTPTESIKKTPTVYPSQYVKVLGSHSLDTLPGIGTPSASSSNNEIWDERQLRFYMQKGTAPKKLLHIKEVTKKLQYLDTTGKLFHEGTFNGCFKQIDTEADVYDILKEQLLDVVVGCLQGFIQYSQEAYDNAHPNNYSDYDLKIVIRAQMTGSINVQKDIYSHVDHAIVLVYNEKGTRGQEKSYTLAIIESKKAGVIGKYFTTGLKDNSIVGNPPPGPPPSWSIEQLKASEETKDTVESFRTILRQVIKLCIGILLHTDCPNILVWDGFTAAIIAWGKLKPEDPQSKDLHVLEADTWISGGKLPNHAVVNEQAWDTPRNAMLHLCYRGLQAMENHPDTVLRKIYSIAMHPVEKWASVHPTVRYQGEDDGALARSSGWPPSRLE
ncbi:hypothetical protein DL96DRAFT_1748791 [Flagelloscypha sp. PMI_526]|nr:hypothetical protein DL96DRAFT_1748791 [Flagelloscypha sp. PMI_526]